MNAWHAFLATLPNDVVPSRTAVGSRELLATPDGAAIAGWQQLMVELSADAAGLRIVLVVLDGSGRPIIASDTVLHWTKPTTGGPDAPMQMRQDSIGGRIEADGTFRGTYWQTEGPEPAKGEEPRWDMKPSEPTASQVSALMTLAEDVVRRQPPVDESGSA